MFREAEEGGANVKFPGAIKRNTHVLAIMRDNKTWELGKVMEVRERIIDEDIEETDFERAMAKLKKNLDDNDEPEEQPSQLSHHRANKRTLRRDYEYYITYLAHERRNDRWLPEIGLKIDE